MNSNHKLMRLPNMKFILILIILSFGLIVESHKQSGHTTDPELEQVPSCEETHPPSCECGCHTKQKSKDCGCHDPVPSCEKTHPPSCECGCHIKQKSKDCGCHDPVPKPCPCHDENPDGKCYCPPAPLVKDHPHHPADKCPEPCSCKMNDIFFTDF